MSTLTLEMRPRHEQTEFNLRRWEEVLADPDLRRYPGRVETDRHGRITMSPPPAPEHGRLQIEIGALLKQLLPRGVTVGECAVSTADGVKGLDVAWASRELWEEGGKRACFVRPPEICVEIISPSNSEEEITEKMSLYFEGGAKEVWVCGAFGAMSFFAPGGRSLRFSEMCRDFPRQV